MKNRPILFLIPCFLLLFMPGAAGRAAERPSLYFQHGDWELACDNTRVCRAAGYQSDDDSLPISVLLTRKAGPGAPVTGQLQIWPGESIIASRPAAIQASLRVDGKPLGQVTLPFPDLTANLTRDQVAALLASLVRVSRVEVEYAGAVWRLSDQGAAAVLLKMDDFQGRVDTPGALVRKGKKNEARALAPLPAPVVDVAPVSRPLPGDARFVKENRAALLAALRKTGKCDALSDPGMALTGRWPDNEPDLAASRLTRGSMLLSMTCWQAAYNHGIGYWVVNSTPPWQPVFAIEGTEYKDGVISVLQKGRGLSDCLSMETWAWDGKRFVRVEASGSGLCKGFPGGAWKLYTVVTQTRKSRMN
jgi:hypothetical protein